jgi:hypothetical protein
MLGVACEHSACHLPTPARIPAFDRSGGEVRAVPISAIAMERRRFIPPDSCEARRLRTRSSPTCHPTGCCAALDIGRHALWSFAFGV